MEADEAWKAVESLNKEIQLLRDAFWNRVADFIKGQDHSACALHAMKNGDLHLQSVLKSTMQAKIDEFCIGCVWSSNSMTCTIRRFSNDKMPDIWINEDFLGYSANSDTLSIQDLCLSCKFCLSSEVEAASAYRSWTRTFLRIFLLKDLGDIVLLFLFTPGASCCYCESTSHKK